MSEHDVPRARVITSPGNPRVKWLVSLRKRRARDTESVWLVEGYAEVRLAVDSGVRPRSLFYCPDLVRTDSQLELLGEDAVCETDVVALARPAFERASLRESPDGWLAVVPALSHNLQSLRLPGQPLVLVCEAVEKPGNLGALLRTADAAGVDAVIAASPVTDWGNPNVVHASKGALFAVPTASAPSDEVAAWLTTRGLQIVAADPDADRLVTAVDLRQPTAVVVGAEHSGLTEAWSGSHITSARLPMAGRINSLNVSTAAAVVLDEAIRQRGVHT